MALARPALATLVVRVMIVLATSCSLAQGLLLPVGPRQDAGAAPPDSAAPPGADASLDAAADASLDAAVDASLDAAVDASLDATIDAMVDAAPPPSCDELYGAAEGYIYCGETPESCSFGATTNGTCRAVCEAFGGTCLDGFDNPNEAGRECEARDQEGCDADRITEYCVCSR